MKGRIAMAAMAGSGVDVTRVGSSRRRLKAQKKSRATREEMKWKRQARAPAE